MNTLTNRKNLLTYFRQIVTLTSLYRYQDPEVIYWLLRITPPIKCCLLPAWHTCNSKNKTLLLFCTFALSTSAIFKIDHLNKKLEPWGKALWNTKKRHVQPDLHTRQHQPPEITTTVGILNMGRRTLISHIAECSGHLSSEIVTGYPLTIT